MSNHGSLLPAAIDAGALAAANSSHWLFLEIIDEMSSQG